jgi:hypothetical protein
MQDHEPFVSLAIALGCGLLIGLQREHAAKETTAEITSRAPRGQITAGEYWAARSRMAWN